MSQLGVLWGRFLRNLAVKNGLVSPHSPPPSVWLLRPGSFNSAILLSILISVIEDSSTGQPTANSCHKWMFNTRLSLDCQGVLRPISKVCKSWDTSSLSKDPTQFWHYLPRDCVRFHRLRIQSYKAARTPKLQTPVASPGCCQVFCLNCYRLEAPRTLSEGLITLLEQLTELRETYYLLNYQFIIKRI